MNLEIFKELGLNDRETNVYITLIKEGELNASKIATFSKINRTTVYLELDNLIRKGLVNFVIKNSKKYFSAANPEKLLDILEERKNKVSKVITELNLLKKTSDKVQVQVFEGKEGVKNLYLDLLKINSEILVFGGTGNGFKEFKYYYPQIYRKIDKINIRGRMIVNFNTQKDFKVYDESNILVKYMPENFDSKVTTVIYENKVALQSLQKDNMYFLLIEDKNLADSYRNTFEFMWKKLK